MTLIIWDSDYSVGVDSLDADHIVLISLINHIHEASQSAVDEAAVGKILEALIEQAKAHFRREEEFLGQIGYPDFDEHVRQHRLIADQLIELAEECLRYPGGDTIEEIIKLLGLWLEEHILKDDRRYKTFLENEANAGPS